ncbi:MAG: helix-turn-helix domain-containing protein [Gammaproteobacteria bacterium]|nr:helix-turn-helix domain-containing protein [Gammaproteobacteria bacterium]
MQGCHMDLQEYLNLFPRSQRVAVRTEIAKSHGVTEVTVRSWANGSRRHPFIKEAIEMTERLTSGKVSRYDLRPDIFGDCPD